LFRFGESFPPGVLFVLVTFVEVISMRETMMWLWRDEAGQDLTEYALLLVMLSLAVVASMGTIANTLKNVFSNAAANLSTAAT
jgi:Flp pilus assembly pilin Flp